MIVYEIQGEDIGTRLWAADNVQEAINLAFAQWLEGKKEIEEQIQASGADVIDAREEFEHYVFKCAEKLGHLENEIMAALNFSNKENE